MTRTAPRSAPDRARLRRWRIGIAVLAVVAILVAWRVLAPGPVVPPPPVTATVVPAEPASPPAPAPEPVSPPPAAAPPAPAPAPVVAAPPPEPELPPLKSVDIVNHPIREVPPEKNPPRQDSTALDMTRPPPGYGGGYHPSEGPGHVVPKQFQGGARVTGATALTVGGIQVQLFGVKPPLPSDRCELAGTPMSCVELAKKRLQERFGRSDQVNCRTPNPQPGMVVAFAICLDANGIDLGSFLLNEGLALADTGQSYDYVGAEGVARTLKHGLWKFR
jgi:endonuclease YncB( thermonuclease family)